MKALNEAADGADIVSQETSIPLQNVISVLALLKDGGTVPFIARYRKEATGYLDEVAILQIRDLADKIAEIEKRREAILHSCKEQGVMTEALEHALQQAKSLPELEDVYLPYRPKRKTRASAAKEKGLEGLAVRIMKQRNDASLEEAASRYVNPEKGVATTEEAVAGARDIIAEAISEHAGARQRMRGLFLRRAVIRASEPRKTSEKDGKNDGDKFRDYIGSETDVASAPSHRILALLRGEREGVLRLRIEPEESAAWGVLRGMFVRGDGPETLEVDAAMRDAYKRLLAPSMETELRSHLKEAADDDAIKVFAENLSAVLMASPFGGRPLLALDPGFRTGCKTVVLNERGTPLRNETIYPFFSETKAQEAERIVRELLETYRLDAVVVGNGTAGRETESWLRALRLPVQIVMVNESGASIYSASDVAREEFPDLDLTVRGAISIGRRFQDPLAELVKIDPKSIGVGQYQHDVDQKKLRTGLDDVVVSCVNKVGVDVNSASKELLKYVSGLNPTLAANIVRYREEQGGFRSREDLRRVPRLGPKAFEQSAGFLRIRGGTNPLDASAVHPENYDVVAQIARSLGCTVGDLMQDERLRAKIVQTEYPGVGEATFRDIVTELAKPGRDPRDAFEPFSFDENVHEPNDLREGMVLPGIVSNITDFGAFVDIGVHLDGLLHRSKFKGRAGKKLAPGSRVTVEVLQVDLARKRISLGFTNKTSAEGDAAVSGLQSPASC